MLYANSPAVQDRINAYVRKPSLCPLPLAGEADGRLAARLERYGCATDLYRTVLANLAMRELSAIHPAD